MTEADREYEAAPVVGLNRLIILARASSSSSRSGNVRSWSRKRGLLWLWKSSSRSRRDILILDWELDEVENRLKNAG